MALTRDDHLDTIDASWRRQIARIQEQLATQEKARSQRRIVAHEEQPDVWQSRGHAVGPRRQNLSELDGDID